MKSSTFLNLASFQTNISFLGDIWMTQLW